MIKDPEKEKQNNEAPENNAAPAEEAAVEKDLADALKKADEYLAAWQRAQADFINYKRRNEQERKEFGLYANAEMLKKILPVVDDLERALENVPEDIAGHEWVEGVRLVERKFKSNLDAAGVKQVLALGMAFDPNYHEAVHQEAGPEGVVVGEFQKGYLLNDKLLRPARVVVGNGEEESKEEE
jgi:molecular chaperone GrpE